MLRFLNYKPLIFMLICFTAVLFFVPRAQAASTFNGNDYLLNWSEKKGPIELKNSSNLDNDSCKNTIFQFQKDNLFVGTFCDLGSIIGIFAADFATNATCTIQKVAMGNYDSSITFKSLQSGGICVPSANSSGALKTQSGADIFGRGSVASSSNSSGIYKVSLSQVTSDLTNGWVYDTFKIVRNFATVAALVALMIFAFANILHVDINTYTIKKMIPNIIVAVLGSYLAIYAVSFISRGIDFAYRLEFFSPYNVLHPFYNIMGGNFGALVTGAEGEYYNSLSLIFSIGGKVLGSDEPMVSILSGFLGVFFLIIPAIVVFAFEYVMALRPIAIYLLVIISPLAFAAYVFPTGQNLFKKWTTIMLIALFYAPAVHLILYIINRLSFNTSSASILFILLILVKTAVFALLIRLPFTIESDIQKISLMLASTSLGSSFGFKNTGATVKVKQENKNTVSDQALSSKAAKSLIAPIHNQYNRNLQATSQIQTRQRKTLGQIFSRASEPLVKNLQAIGERAHQNNLGRASNLLVSSIADLSPQALRKIVSSSNRTIFSDNNLLRELKNKNGQLLDDEGAVIRADASKKVYRQAHVLNQNLVGNPEAVKLLSKKQMLSILPIDILKKSLQQGILTQDDIRANFKGDPQKVIEYLSRARPGGTLNSAELSQQLKKDFFDSSSGFTDLAHAIESSLQANSTAQSPAKVLSALKNQPDFNQNGMYYLSRLSDIHSNAQKNLASELKQAGTPEQTAMAISQNSALNYDQIASYVPNTTTAATLSAIRETIAERNTSKALISQVSSSLEENKNMLGQTIADKMSTSLKNGTSRSFDDIKTQISCALKNLNVTASPETVKTALSQVNAYASGASVQAIGAPTAEDIEKAKKKGEAVISTIDEMKMSGVDEKTVVENPAAASAKFSSQVQKTIQDVATGKTKVEPALTSGADAALNTNQVAGTISQALSTKTKDGKSFDQQLGSISQSKNGQTPTGNQGAVNG